ncbi:MAG: SpoIID/LytB domain-containing protein [Gemmatimonadetes bacterium]|nr:SpoIID/LytB domain-containing protein [Gemmatimonadota bacterium]
MAADGATSDEILRRYFPGTNLSASPTETAGTFLNAEADPLWVGLAEDMSSMSFVVEIGPALLCFDRGGSCVGTANSGETYRFRSHGNGQCAFYRIQADKRPTLVGAPSTCDASVQGSKNNITVSVPLKARSYRHGILTFRSSEDTDRFHSIYRLGVEDYLRGISQVPESWPEAAIEAQVVATRSQTVRMALDAGPGSLLGGLENAECVCHLSDAEDGRVFRGWTGEMSHPEWVRAVGATSGRVLTYGGSVAAAMYSSSSGGMTEDYSDVFGGDQIPYLVTVSDGAAFSESAANPHKSWTATYTSTVLADAFNFSWLSNIEITELNASGSVRSVVVSGLIDGRLATVTVSGIQVRSLLSLRSTSFSVTVRPEFDDTEPTAMFSAEIGALHAAGITDGCSPSKYCPERPVTRAEMAAFLVRALELPDATDNVFTDTKVHSLESEIGALHAAGITDGCSPSKYCPERPVTRAEMAAFLVRALETV